MKSPMSQLSVAKEVGGIKSLADAFTVVQIAIEGTAGGAATLLGALAPIAGVVAAIGAVFIGWKIYDNYMQKQAQAAQEAGNAWKETSQSLNNYKDRVIELREQLASGTLSEQEAYQAKSELLSIQQSLTDSYGSQADGINLVNGLLQEQIGLMEQLSQSDANKYLNENQKGINKATKEMEKNRTYYLGQFYDAEGDEASEALKKAIKNSQEKYGDLITTQQGLDGTLQLYFKGDATQAEAALNDFMTDVRNASDELGGNYMLDDIFSYSEGSLKDVNKVLDKYQEVYEQAKAAELTADSTQYKGTNGVSQTAAKWLNDYSKAVEKYNDALANGDTSKISEAKAEFDAVDNSVQSLIDSDMSKYADSFAEIRDQLNDATINAQNFKDAISGADTSDSSKKVKEAAETLKKLNLDDKDFVYAFETDGVQEGEEQINALVQAALDAGVISDTSSEGIQKLANMLVELGIVSGEPVERIEETTASISDMRDAAENLIDGLTTVQSVLSSQQNGKSVSLADFNSDELEDYRSALEYVNGTMQLNAEKVKELAKAKADEQVAINNTNKALEQAKYLENAKKIESLRQSIKDLSGENWFDSEAEGTINKQIEALLEENSTIAATCDQYDLLSASIQEAVSSYQHWLNVQSSSDYGDMADDAVSAIQRIEQTYNKDSDIFGDYGSKKFKAAVDFIVPDSVDTDSIDDIESYMSKFKQYLTFDDKGNADGLNIDTFLKNSVKAGLMSYDKDSSEYNILDNVKMDDFAKKLNMSSGMVQAFFDELQLKGAEFDWSDEAVKTIGDLAIEANEAAESLHSMDEFSDLKIKMDVSDLSTTDEQISALDATIEEMNGVKAKVSVDSSEAEQANSVIQYCITQKQLLSQPDVMRVDTSKVEGDIGNAISLLQQFQDAQNDLEVKAAIGADTSDAEEKVNSLASEIQGLSPDIKTKLNLDTNSVESIQSSINGLTAAKLDVDAHINTEAIDGYHPDSKTCDVIYNPKTDSLPTSFTDINRTVNYVPVTSDLPSSFSTITRYVDYVKTGDVQVNGTAHAGGTAKVGGDWGTAPSGQTLVGELGREIVVDPRTGQWYTVGDNGAEFRDIPAGAIVFNHRQTEDLLAHGYVAGRASALANGTAMVTGGIKWTGDTNGGTKSSGSKGGKSSTKSSGNKSGNISSNKSDKASKTTSDKVKDIIEKFNKYTEKLFDWIEVRLSRLQRKTENYIDKAEKKVANGNYGSAAKVYGKVLSSISDQINANTKGLSKYKSKSNAVLNKAISTGMITSDKANTIRRKVADGTIDISSYGERMRTVIEEYQQWYEKSLKCADAVQDLLDDYTDYAETLYNLPIEKASEKIDAFSDSIDILNSRLDNVSIGNTGKRKEIIRETMEAERSSYNANLKAKTETSKNLSSTRKKIDSVSDKALDGLNKKDKESIIKAANSGQVIDYTKYAKLSDAGKKAIIKYNEALKANKTATADAAKASEEYTSNIKELAEALANIHLEKAENKAEKLDEKLELIDSKDEVTDSASEKNKLADKRIDIERSRKGVYGEAYKESRKDVDKLKNDRNLKEAAASKANKGKSISKEQKLSTEGLKKGSKAYEAVIKWNAAIEAKNDAYLKSEIAKNDYKASVRENTKAKYDNLTDEGNRKQSRLSTALDKAKSKIESRSVFGYSQVSDSAKNEYKTAIDSEESLLALYEKQREEKAKFLKENKKNLSAEDKLAIQEDIDALDESILNAKEDVVGLKEELANIETTKISIKLDKLSESAKKLNDSISLKEAKGYETTAKDYKELIENSQKTVEAYKELNESYRKQQQGLNKNSEKYLDLQSKINDNDASIRQCTIDQENWNNAIGNMPITELEKLMDIYDAMESFYKSDHDLKTALGTDLTKKDYDTLLENNVEKQKAAYDTFIESGKRALAAALSGGAYLGKSSEEWAKDAASAMTEYNNLQKEAIDIRNQYRDDVLWRDFNRSREAAERFEDVLSGINSLLSDDMMFDSDNKLTDIGALMIATDLKSYEEARKAVAEYAAQIEHLNQEKLNGYWTDEEYQSKLDELNKDMYSSASSAKSYMDTIVSYYKNIRQNELDALNEIIDARSEALQKKKEYYDYDKTIKSKTKDIKSLQAQIAALEGVSTAEAKAAKAKLKEQLQEAQDDFDDTVMQHSFDLSQDALSDLKDTLQEALDDDFKNISSDFGKILNVVQQMQTDTVKNADDINQTLKNILGVFGINKTNDGSSTNEFNLFDNVKTKYASGTRSVPHDLAALTNEDGAEIIVTKKGMITPLEKGDGVIPADLTKKLYNMAMSDYSLLPRVNVVNFKTPNFDGISHGVPTINQHYDNLINIEGSADAATVSDIKKLSKDILEKSYQYTSKKIYDGYRKSGGRRMV